jgi:hypothetical protein
MNKSISNIVSMDVAIVCADIFPNAVLHRSDSTDPLLDIWSGIQILDVIHFPQFSKTHRNWLRNIE